MKMIRVFHPFLFFIISIIFGCTPAEQQDTVVVETKGIEQLPTIEVENDGQLGEFLIDSEDKLTELKITNNSNYEIFDLSLNFIRDFESNANMDYALNEFDESIFPGNGGDCTSKLPAGSSCTIRFFFKPDRRGEFFQRIILKYKNLIDEIRVNVKYRAVVGEYATLSFVDENSIFSFGVLDKAKIVEDDHLVEIVNSGGLSAFNTSFEIQNSIRLIDKDGVENTSEIDSGFFVKEHNCPKIIKPNQKCRLIINYSNSNLLQDDPGLFYDAILKINYGRSSNGEQGNLVANFGFTSSAIEASLIFTGITDKLSYSQIITGTKASPKTITVQNDGYKEGVIKSFNFYDRFNRLIAKCREVKVENKELTCRNISGIEVNLSELPFKVYDRNFTSCIGRSMEPKDKNIAGEKCFFDLVYWPSTKFEKVNSDRVNEVYVTLEYDSRLGGVENLKTIPISNISYQFKKPALLQVISLESEQESFSGDVDYESQDNFIHQKFGTFNHETDQFFDIGSKTLVNSPDIGERYTLKIKNVGGETARMKKVSDSQYLFGADGFELPLALDNEIFTQDITSLSDNEKTFYRNVKTTCKEFLAVNSFCEISFFLNLNKVYAQSSANNVLLYDHLGDLLVNTKDLPFKQFNFIYENGSLYNDDGTAYGEKRTVARVSSTIINKGVLRFSNMEQWGNLRKYAFTDKGIEPVYGNESTFDIFVTNVGTNEISYMYFGSGGDLNRNNRNSCSFYKIVDIAQGLERDAVLLKEDYGGLEDIFPTYDCFDIIDHTKLGFKESSGAELDQLSPLISSKNKRGSLKEGQSCVLRLKIKPNLNDLSCFAPSILDETNFTQEFGNDYGVFKTSYNQDFLTQPFSANDEFIGNTSDDLKFLPSYKKYFWKESPIIYYLDGDQNAPLGIDNKILGDNQIYGDEHVLTATKNNDDFELMMSYMEKGNIYIQDVFPMTKTALMRSSHGVKPLNEISDFDFIYPDSYFLNSKIIQNGDFGDRLEAINLENISFHRNSGLFRDADWKIFLGAYANNDLTDHYFNFKFVSSGNKNSTIVGCKIETDDGAFSPGEVAGIIPSSSFYNELINLGCSLNPSGINEKISEIEKLSNFASDGYLLKFVPLGESNYFLKITLTIQDLLNPEGLETLPTRDIVFDFGASSLPANNQNVCFSQGSSCQTGGQNIINFQANNRMDSFFEIEAAKNEVAHQYIEIFNGQNFPIAPIFLFKNTNDQVFLDTAPSSVNVNVPVTCYNSDGTFEIASGESCLIDLTFTPGEVTVSSDFDFVIGYESVNPEFYSGNIQRTFKEIPIKTTVLVNGEILPFKVVYNTLSSGEVVETDICSNDPLSLDTISYTKNSSNYEIKSINIDIGENLFSDISSGIYRKFCLRNFETLPILIWDSKLSWVPETVNGIENLVNVFSSSSGEIQLYVKEHCLLKSMELVSDGKVLKDSPSGYESYGINNGEECLGMIYYRPNANQINNYLNSNFGVFEYFSNHPIDSSPPNQMMGVSIKGKLNPPPAYANLMEDGNARSIYKINTSSSGAEILWKDFSYDTNFGDIVEYLVFVDPSLSVLASDDQIKVKAINPDSANCKITPDQLIEHYSCSVENLNSSSRYYVRVVPVVNFLGDKFLAFDKAEKNIFSFYTTPNSDNYAYSYLENIFIEKSLASDASDLSLGDATEICSQKVDLEVLLNANSINDISHNQITLREWKIILSNIEKYNIDPELIRSFIWLGGSVPNNFGGVVLEDSINSYNLSLEDNFYYQFMWSGSRVPDRFNVATAELPADLTGLPEYGSLLLTDLDSYYFNTRCFVQLAP